MNPLRRLAAGVWHFLIGEDPWIAAGVATAIGVTAALAGIGVPAWWVMPVTVLGGLSASLRRAG